LGQGIGKGVERAREGKGTGRGGKDRGGKWRRGRGIEIGGSFVIDFK